jgi:glycosyltransferase involved in cell wall biosynthesis
MSKQLSIDSGFKVTALIPAFNPGIYIKESVASLLAQKPFIPRIVVIDDCCTDGSISEIESWKEQSLIEIVRNARNLGKSASLNRAFAIYDSDYFIIQDADDIAMPDRVARQVAFMDANPDVGLSSSFVHYINSEGRKIAEGKLDLLNDKKLSEYLTGEDPFGLYCPAVIMRANVAKDPDLDFRGQFWPADDIDLWNRVAEKGHIVRVQPEFLVGYRVHGNSAVTSGFKRTRMQYEWVRACLRARRKGQREPSKEQFLDDWNAAPIWKKINRARKFLAKGYYRAAGFAWAERKCTRALWSAALAVGLQPEYALRRAGAQLGSKFK